MPPARRKPGLKAQRKLEAVLGGAREVFMALGYERASVERIARAAGVSK
ncbi:MAG: TetR family transcriptional regulator, partial [Gemmobacter sp.]